jgi:hypothetical protein
MPASHAPPPPTAAATAAAVAAVVAEVGVAVVPADMPFALRTVLAKVADARNAAWREQARVLAVARARLVAAEGVLAASPDVLATRRPLAALRAQLNLVTRGLDTLLAGTEAKALTAHMGVLAARYVAADAAARRQRQEELACAARSEVRFLPAGPAAPVVTAPTATSSAVGAVPSRAGLVTLGAAPGEQEAAGGAGRPPAAPAAASASDLVAAFVREAGVAFGTAPRPVTLTPFDMCPTCRVALRYNQTLQQLVCPVPGCDHWKRFADMTSNALAYGEEVEFVKHAYKPVTHLDEIMKIAEATETYVVPPEALHKVMECLWSWGVRTPEDITIPKVRRACKEVEVKMDNTVQIYSRITGRAPRRMTPFMKDQMRIMFHAAEAPFRRHAAGRTNHLSFPFTLRKYCEILGYWEMLDSWPMLRGPGNISVHDVITSKVFHDLGWSFTHTVTRPGVVVGGGAGGGGAGAGDGLVANRCAE